MTGLFTLDVDRDPEATLKAFWESERLSHLPYVCIAARSISGMDNGSMYVIVKCTDEVTEYASYHPVQFKKALKEKFRVDTGLMAGIDDVGGQCRYLSHDPEAFINREVVPITMDELERYLVTKREAVVQTFVDMTDRQECTGHDVCQWAYEAAVEECGAPVAGNSYEFRVPYTRYAYTRGATLEEAVNFAEQVFPTKDNDHRQHITHLYNNCESYGLPTDLLPTLGTPTVRSLSELKFRKCDNGYKGNKLYLNDEGYVDFGLEIFEERYVSIEADTGTGKTHRVMELAEKNDVPLVIFEPYRSATDQKADEAQWHAIVSGTAPNADTLQVGTFNAITKVNCSEHISASETILVIDEAHLLVTEGYRREVMEELYEVFTLYKGVILLSATSIESPIFEGFKRYVYVHRNPPKKTLNIIEAEDPTAALIDTLDRDSLNVIYLDSKNSHSVKAELLASYGYSVATLSSDDKTSELYERIIKGEKIPSDIDVLMITRVLTHAVDMFSDRPINYVIYPSNNDTRLPEPYQVVQFTNRFRRHDVTGITMIAKRNEYRLGREFRYHDVYKDLKQKAYRIIDNANDLLLAIADGHKKEGLVKELEKNPGVRHLGDDFGISEVSLAQGVYEIQSRYERKNINAYLSYLHDHGFTGFRIATHKAKLSEGDSTLIKEKKKQQNEEKEKEFKIDVEVAYSNFKNNEELGETTGAKRLLELGKLVGFSDAKRILLKSKFGNSSYKKIREMAIIENRRGLYKIDELIYNEIKLNVPYTASTLFEMINGIYDKLPEEEKLAFSKIKPEKESQVFKFLSPYFDKQRSSDSTGNTWKLISDKPLDKFRRVAFSKK